MKEQAVKNAGSEEQKNSIRDIGPQQLCSSGILIEQNGRYYPSNAYAVLTGCGALHVVTQCGVFKGSTKETFVDRREYGGPVWEQIDQSYQFVLRNIHMGACFEGIYRQDIYEIPPDAIRELIINAAVHRSYLDHGNTQIAVYDNRLEITSPGKIPMGQTLERMKEGYSQIRNEALAYAFSYMNLIEHWGSGIPRIIGKVKAAGLPEPDFIGGEVDLRVNIYRGQIEVSDLNNDLNDPDCDSKDDLESRLIKVLRRNPEMTQKALGEELSVSAVTIKRTLMRMKQEGKVFRDGSNRKGKWILSDKM